MTLCVSIKRSFRFRVPLHTYALINVNIALGQGLTQNIDGKRRDLPIFFFCAQFSLVLEVMRTFMQNKQFHGFSIVALTFQLLTS